MLVRLCTDCHTHAQDSFIELGSAVRVKKVRSVGLHQEPDLLLHPPHQRCELRSDVLHLGRPSVELRVILSFLSLSAARL